MFLKINNVANLVYRTLTDSHLFWTLAAVIIVADAILTEVIIQIIPYTEIDWKTYMVHTSLYLEGERDYSKITGPTGPLVYPAGHVRIHEFLYKMTNSGQNLQVVQHVYGFLYIITLCLSCAIYRQAGPVPNWLIVLLPLSKRLHSIFVLRLFNDCWALALVQAAILTFQCGLDETGVLLYSVALSVKMSILLYLPGLIVIVFKRKGFYSTLRYILTIIAIQILAAASFLRHDPWTYLRLAFDFGRVFLFKWTVNWRFIGEEIFLSRHWSLGLLIGHLSLLILFGLFKWCKADGGVMRVIERGLRQPFLPAGLAPLTGEGESLEAYLSSLVEEEEDVATILFTSNLIGILFARSLHYQFYSWYAQQLPFLAWKSKFPWFINLALLTIIEYSWNTYPSTTISSTLLLLAHILLIAGIYSQ